MGFQFLPGTSTYSRIDEGISNVTTVSGWMSVRHVGKDKDTLTPGTCQPDLQSHQHICTAVIYCSRPYLSSTRCAGLATSPFFATQTQVPRTQPLQTAHISFSFVSFACCPSSAGEFQHSTTTPETNTKNPASYRSLPHLHQSTQG